MRDLRAARQATTTLDEIIEENEKLRNLVMWLHPDPVPDENTLTLLNQLDSDLATLLVELAAQNPF